jgi:hypothetical protein
MEAPFSGGMGSVVPGAEVITGVLELLTSLLLQPAGIIKAQRTRREFCTQRRKGAKEIRRAIFAPLRLCVSDLFFEVILYCGRRFVLFLGERFTGDSIFTFNPPAEIN